MNELHAITEDEMAALVPLARIIARRRGSQMLDSEQADLESAAMMGLLEAARKFDGRGSWKEFARDFVEFRVLDEIRRLLRRQHNREQPTNVLLRYCRPLADAYRLADPRSRDLDTALDWPKVEQALGRLRCRQSETVRLELRGWTATEIARRQGVTVGNISHDRATTVRRLRGLLRISSERSACAIR